VNTNKGQLNIPNSSLRFKRRYDFIREKNFGDKKMSFTLPFEPIQIIFTIVNMSHHENLKISNRYISKNILATYCNNIISSMSTTRGTFWTKI
jgi:hypothetical protein